MASIFCFLYENPRLFQEPQWRRDMVYKLLPMDLLGLNGSGQRAADLGKGREINNANLQISSLKLPLSTPSTGYESGGRLLWHRVSLRVKWSGSFLLGRGSRSSSQHIPQTESSAFLFSSLSDPVCTLKKPRPGQSVIIATVLILVSVLFLTTLFLSQLPPHPCKE